jgi:hypothetical protein
MRRVTLLAFLAESGSSASFDSSGLSPPLTRTEMWTKQPITRLCEDPNPYNVPFVMAHNVG